MPGRRTGPSRCCKILERGEFYVAVPGNLSKMV